MRTLALALLLTAPSFALDRNAFTFTRYDLAVTVTPEKGELRASGRITARNDSTAPQRNFTLQISSSLAWTSITAGGKQVTAVRQPYQSDIDHTGEVNEAILSLPGDVAPGQSITVDVAYEGQISSDATRLMRIGVPQAVAQRNDWDQISATFTAVRGLGYVAWYPVAMDAVSLSEGREVFDALADWKRRHAASSMAVRIEFPAGFSVAADAEGMETVRPAPTPAVNLQWPSLAQVVPAFSLASYEVLEQPPQSRPVVIWYLRPHGQVARELAAAASRTAPLLQDWFGAQRHPVRVAELPYAEASPWEGGAMLFTPLRPAASQELELVMAHQLAHAMFDSPRPWIYEGLAHFAQALVREKQAGREAGIALMNAQLGPLVEAERENTAPETSSSRAGRAQAAPPGQGDPLATSNDEIMFRTKAMFCWWMLRDMIGAENLQHALARYRVAADKEPAYLQRLVEAEARKSYEWWFDDWIYRDRGLPDFRVESAYPRETVAGAYGVTVTVENAGAAAAEVPVIVRAESGQRVSRTQVAGHAKVVARVLVPARPVEATVNDGSVPEMSASNNAVPIEVKQ